MPASRQDEIAAYHARFGGGPPEGAGGARRKCSNCGNRTQYGNAVPARLKARLCSPCFKQAETGRTYPGSDAVYWKERSMYGPGITPSIREERE